MDKLTATQPEKQSSLRRYFAKMKGQAINPLQANMKDACTGLVGGFIAISILLYLTKLTNAEWLMAPLGASCVLVFAVWNTPLAQPRNIIGGHALSAVIGLALYHTFGSEPWTLALGVGLAICCMILTKTTHPPAGANPIIIMLGGYDWSYLLTPVLAGAVVIVIVALIVNNLRGDRSYPTFWW